MTTGQQLKLAGLERAARKHNGALAAAQAWARQMGRYGAELTSDDVKAKLESLGVSDLGNAAGAIFAGPDWVCTGWKRSTRPSAHARAIRVWKLKSY